MTSTRYDIYVRQGGRWRRHESLSGDDKDAAILRAVTLDAEGAFDGIRAMSVVEYGGGRAPLETLAWISPHLNKVAAVKQQMQSQAAAAEKAIAERSANARPEPAESTPPLESQASPSAGQSSVKKVEKVAKARKSASEVQAAGKVIGSIILATVIAAVVFVPVSALVHSIGGKLGLAGSQVQYATLGVSVIVFLMSASTLISRVYRDYQAMAQQTEESAFSPPPPVDPLHAQMPGRTPQPHAFAPTLPDDSHVADETNDTDAVQDAADVEQEQQAASAGVTAGLNEQMRRTVLQFMASALLAIKDEVPQMNQHVIFGLNLFGAGAAEFYGEHAGLKKLQAFILVREVIGALGNSDEGVDTFCRQYEIYKAEERYRLMTAAGRIAMSRSIEGDPDPFQDFGEVFKMWTSDAAARAQVQGIICIMFTDLVGSTQMTHERGDYGAQEIVRIHNAIVRSALAAHHGREVKHTGDGIMSSFTSAGNAVRAAIHIQQALSEHNSLNQAMPVRVRVGLNAGEAVHEEDDFFGTTVQLAARVCDKAGEGEVFITGNVMELSKSQGIPFEDAGMFEMKGVPEPMTLYRVSITDGEQGDADTL